MTVDVIIRLIREALLLILLLSLGPMLASLLVGLLAGLFQATTQIQEQTISFVPKLIVVFVTLAIAGPWMLMQVVRFSTIVLESISMVR